MIPAKVALADSVLDWNAHAAQAIITVGGQVPPRALIRLAMVHLAIYDAVNAIEGQPFQSYASAPKVARPASADAAVAAAAHDVLVALFPGQTTDLDAKYVAALAALPDDAAKTNGIAVGQEAAAAILAARAQDGRDGTVTYVPGSGPGTWIPTPPAFLGAQAPETPLVQPFALQSASQFRPDAPPELGSRRWARDYNEVKALGSLVGSATNGRTDRHRPFLERQPAAAMDSCVARAVGRTVSASGRERALLRHALDGIGRRIDCLLGCQVLLQRLAAGHGHSRRRVRRQSATRHRIRHGSASLPRRITRSIRRRTAASAGR